MIKIEPIKAFSDNYIWLVTTNEGLLVVDPGDASPVEAYLKDNSRYLGSQKEAYDWFLGENK